MSFNQYADFDGLGLADLVKRKEVSPLDLVEAAIERIERRNDALNAIVYKAYDEARATAKKTLPEGPFRGVPFLIKDLGAAVANWPCTSGSRFAANVVDEEDCGLVRRYREAGTVLLAKTNTPEYGITGTTESALLGPCRSPWNLERISGGSSGGAAAAVAAGITPMAHASDGLGSIRIPAACCGLVGMKPTRDRNPNLPDGFDYAMGFVANHIVSRTVRDCAAMLDFTGRPEPGSPYAIPAKAGPYLEEVSRSPGRLRIAWAPSPDARPALHEDVRAVMDEAVRVLKALGHDVFPRALKVNYRALYAARAPVSGANFAAGMKRLIDQIGREPEDDELEPLTWASLKGGRRVTGEEAFWGWQELRMLTRGLVREFEDIDVYLCPVMTCPPPKIGYLSPVTQSPREANARAAEVYPFTPPFNFTGQPSLSLPLGMSRDGLPVGLMFTAKYADEATLFRLAGQLEKEMPWKDRKPAIWN